MKRLILAALFLTIATSSAHADGMHINGDSRYGCADKDYYNKTVQISAQNDLEAFKKVLGAGLATGMCVMFEAGEPVHVVDAGFLMSKIRRQGDVAEYWIETQILSRN